MMRKIEDDKNSLEDRVKDGPAFTSTFVSSPPQVLRPSVLVVDVVVALCTYVFL